MDDWALNPVFKRVEAEGYLDDSSSEELVDVRMEFSVSEDSIGFLTNEDVPLPPEGFDGFRPTQEEFISLLTTSSRQAELDDTGPQSIVTFVWPPPLTSRQYQMLGAVLLPVVAGISLRETGLSALAAYRKERTEIFYLAGNLGINESREVLAANDPEGTTYSVSTTTGPFKGREFTKIRFL